MSLLLERERATLLAHGARSACGEAIDPYPVVKLFTPEARAVWLLSELAPHDPDLAFGLCDLGFGHPELGFVRLAEIDALRLRLDVRVERDAAFYPFAPLSAYATAARRAGHIVTDAAAVLAPSND